jgi:hypothetical protein
MGRNRKKVATLGSFAEYKDSKKKAQVIQPAPQQKPMPQPSGQSSILAHMAPAPNAKDQKMNNK